jgi:uncharacterized integral membrane protein
MEEKDSGQTPPPGAAPAESETKRQGSEFEETWQPTLWSKLIVLVLLVGYGIALIVANSKKVEISFLLASVTVSLVWLILLCFVLGLVSGVLVSQMHRHRKSERARLKQLAKQAEQSKKAKEERS